MVDVQFEWPWHGQMRRSEVRLTVPVTASPTTPLVLLLHGTSGTIDDMGDPATHPGFNHEVVEAGVIRDRGWHEHPNVGFWSIGVDELVEVTGWEPYLNNKGFPTINYSQSAPRGPLRETATELRHLIIALGALPEFGGVANRGVVLIGHSRGGILARQVLVDLQAEDAKLRSRITTCITVHAPNTGSNLANVAVALDSAAVGWRMLWPDPQIDALLVSVHNEVGALAYHDYSVGSATLETLKAAEPVPGVAYYTFGGTRPVLFQIRGWAFTHDSSVPQVHNPPFRWRTVYQAFGSVPSPMAALPELAPGFGDVLVSADRSRLPFSRHRDNPLNHASCLWDPGLHSQVLHVLTGLDEPEPYVGSVGPNAPLDGTAIPTPVVPTSAIHEPAARSTVSPAFSVARRHAIPYHLPPWWATVPPWSGRLGPPRR